MIHCSSKELDIAILPSDGLIKTKLKLCRLKEINLKIMEKIAREIAINTKASFILIYL